MTVLILLNLILKKTTRTHREDNSSYPGSSASFFALSRSAAQGYDGQVTMSLGDPKDMYWLMENLAT